MNLVDDIKRNQKPDKVNKEKEQNKKKEKRKIIEKLITTIDLFIVTPFPQQLIPNIDYLLIPIIPQPAAAYY